MAKPLPPRPAGKARPSRKAKADPEDPDALRRRGIYEKAKTFEERVAELFSLQGHRTTVDYKRDDMQFDIRVELTGSPFPVHALVECKDTGDNVTQQQVREFASKVGYLAEKDRLTYHGILIASSGFANNAYEVARQLRVHLQTYEQFLRSLVDLRPMLDDAVRSFQGTALERLYVEQDLVFETDIQGSKGPRKQLAPEILHWLEKPSGTFLALLGDFGSGKTSFSKRLASELAAKSRAELAEGTAGTRAPILIDLREGGSTTVTLENLLTHHYQRLSSQPFNPQTLLQLNREGHLLLIFDGFDEMIAYTEPGRHVENLRQILRAAEGKAKVLLTCRTHYFRDRPEALSRLGNAPAVISTQGATGLYEEIKERPGAEVGYLMEFREEQISEYLSKALPPHVDWQEFREQIRQTYNLENLAECPLLLEIIVKTLPRLTERQGMVTVADLYETYCAIWFSHTDFRLTLTRDRRVALVEYLARLVWDSPENRVHYDLLFEKATEFFKDRPLMLHDKERIDYEVRTALFLHRDAEGHYSFIHRSFLEFFVARTLRDGLKEGDPGCLALKRITREVAFFLEFWPEANRIPELAGKVLAASYQHRISENALLLLYFHAMGTLGPLIKDEEPNALQIRDAFSKMRPKILCLEGVDLEGADLHGIDLSSARLEGARLSGTNLRHASLRGAQMTRANLAFADLRMGSAEGVDLSESHLNHLAAQEVDFRKAILRNSDLSFAFLARADFRGANLEGIQTIGTGLLGARGLSRILANLAHTAGSPQPKTLEFRTEPGDVDFHIVAWSPDGTCVAAGSDNGIVVLWDTASGATLHTFEAHGSTVTSGAWSPDGRQFASGSEDMSIKIWDAAKGKINNVLKGHDDSVQSLAWSPNGLRLASGSHDGTVKIWDAENGRTLKTLGCCEWVNSVAWSPDNRRLASGYFNGEVRIWNAESGKGFKSLKAQGAPVNSLAWSPDGGWLAFGCDDGTITVCNLDSGRPILLEGHSKAVNSVAWSLEGQRLASGCDDNTVKIWEPASGRVLKTLEKQTYPINSVAWSPDDLHLASGYYGGVDIWDIESYKLIGSLEGYADAVLSIAWSPDGRQIASACPESAITIWDVENAEVQKIFGEPGLPIASVAWSSNGRWIASGSFDRMIRIWDEESGVLKTLREGAAWVRFVAWSLDGKWLASCSSDNTIKIWHVGSSNRLKTFLGHRNWISSLAWSPDGRRIASSSADETIIIWDIESEKEVHLLKGHDGWVNSVAWCPGGRRLASGADDAMVKIWDTESGRTLRTLEGPSTVLFVAWSPDGLRLASSSSDAIIRVWDSGSGKLLQTLPAGPRVETMAWSPDGRKFAAASEQGFIDLWDLESNPRRLVRFHHLRDGSTFVATPDGYVSGPPEALEYVRFGDGWALYDLTDLPERYSPERVAAALNPLKPAPSPESPAAESDPRRPRSPRSRNGKGPGRRSA